MHVIQHGVDVGSAAAERPAGILKRRLALPDETFLFGFFGRFMPEKGFDLIVAAVEELSRRGYDPAAFRLLAVNHGGYVREYTAEIEARRVDRYFAFLDLQPGILDLLRGVDLSLMPSRSEAAGYVAMEALAVGCPLIASDCVGLREVTRDTPAVSIPAGDAGALADAMQRALGMADLRRPFQEYAEKARGRFDVDKATARLERLMLRLVEATA